MIAIDVLTAAVRILIVRDTPNARRALASILARYGHLLPKGEN